MSEQASKSPFLRMQKPGFAFGHQARVGKDEACRVLSEQYNYTTISLAEPVYEIVDHIQQVLGLPREKNRKLLQFIGEGLREVVGRDVWLSIALGKIRESFEQGKPVCISDVRYRNEADAFRGLGLTLVKISRSNRPAIDNPTHPSEVDLVDYDFDIVIRNDSTLQAFQQTIAKLHTDCEKVSA